MDTVAESLKAIRSRVVIPTSIPGLVTDRVLVMSFLDGVPLTQLSRHTSNLSDAQKTVAMKRVRSSRCGLCGFLAFGVISFAQGAGLVQVITRASEAYGRMLLEKGLFQADGHPGNILVMRGGRIGLIDYGQSKQLSASDQQLVARLVLALTRCACYCVTSPHRLDGQPGAQSAAACGACVCGPCPRLFGAIYLSIDAGLTAAVQGRCGRRQRCNARDGHPDGH